MAPDTKIDSGPGASTPDTTPTFAFSADETGATFACSVDGGCLATCTTPATLPALVLGPHPCAVRGVDGAGFVDASPAAASFTVTASPPGTLTITGLSASPA